MTALDPRILEMLRDPRALRTTIAGRSGRLASRVPYVEKLRWRLTSRERVFSEIYRNQLWGSAESGSGTGSELRATDNVREQLTSLLRRLGVTSLLDAPCGDWNWMQHIKLPVDEYYGIDIVPEVIAQDERRFGDARHHFSTADLTCDPLPKADLILCRDCFVHVSFEDAGAIIENFRRSGATWILLNTYPEVERNRGQLTGHRWRRLNFRLAPFGFPEPLEIIADGGDVDPSSLALWRLSDLPRVGVS